MTQFFQTDWTPSPHPVTQHYLNLDDLTTLLDRSRSWVLYHLGVYGDHTILWKATHWHKHLHRPPRCTRQAKAPRAHLRGHALLRYLRSVGLPMPLVSRLLWDALREDWHRELTNRIVRRSRRHPRRIYQLPPWEAISSAPSAGPPPTAPPSCSSTSTDSATSLATPSSRAWSPSP